MTTKRAPWEDTITRRYALLNYWLPGVLTGIAGTVFVLVIAGVVR